MTSADVVREAGGGGRRLHVSYVCGALKVTTRPDSRSTGPRAHVTGMISGLRSLGHEVTPFLAGDLVPARLSAAGHADGVLSGGSWRGRTSDAVRVGLGPLLGAGASWTARTADVMYERQATYQKLGTHRPRRIPWVVESNGPFWYEASQERGALSFPVLAKRRELSAYRGADLVVAVSDSLKAVLVEAGGLVPDDVLVVPNAVDPQRFAAVSPRQRRPEEPLVVGFVGHVIDWAGLTPLVEAVATARARGSRIEALIAGDGPARRDVEAVIARRGLSGAVRLLGHLPWTDIPSMLGRCHVAYSGQLPMAIGSMYHSPLKLYEYSAAGLPVIASDFPDAQDLVHGSDAGWLVSPGDVDGIAAALQEAEEAGCDLARSGSAVKAHVLSRHTWRQRAASLTGELAARGLLQEVLS